MKELPNKGRVLLALALGVLLVAGEVDAQRGSPRAQILQLNQRGMEAYANLKIDQSLRLLAKAEGLCRQNNVRGNELSRTYLNMGVVEAGGRQNNAAAMDYFKRAVCLNRSAALDPLNSTPEVQTLFNMARAQAQMAGACGSMQPTPQPVPQPGPQPTPQPARQPAPAKSQLLRHTPVTQQLRLVPVPIYAEVNPKVRAGKVVLFYRTVGERIFQQVQMDGHKRGYAATIGCDVLQTFDPTGIEYYIAVLDKADQLLGTSGTEAQPHQTAMVQVLTTPVPALPDEDAPAKCMEECPPWNPDCNKGCKQMGDLCDSSSECCSGMICLEEICTPGGDEDDASGGPLDLTLRMSISVGTGTGLINSGTEIPYNQVSVNPDNDVDSGGISVGTGFTWSKLHFRINPMFYLTEKVLLGVGFRGGLALDFKDPDVMPLAPLVMANVAYRFVGEGSDTFELDALFGLGGGIILHKVPYKDCAPVQYQQTAGHPWWDEAAENDKLKEYSDGTPYLEACSHEENAEKGLIDTIGPDNEWIGPDGPNGDSTAVDSHYFREAGYLAIEVGLDGYIWLTRNIGINIGLMVDLLVPNFALNLDVQAGVAARF